MSNYSDNSIKFDPSRRRFLQTGLAGTACFITGGYASGSSDPDFYEMIEQEIRISNLPPAFTGFTICLVSDIHSNTMMTKEDMNDYAAAINQLKTDLIVVPGDFVDSKTEQVYPFAEAFSQLQAPFGVYGCLGNHDYFADVDIVAKEVDACGVKLLRNDAVEIVKDGARFHLLGIDDVGWRDDPRRNFDKALSLVHTPDPKILLSHKPYYFDLALEKKIDLTLSGHTHGGQIVFAKIGDTFIAPARLASRYVAGLYTNKESQMYVTRGVGTVGIFPIRFNCPPEITKITLV